MNKNMATYYASQSIRKIIDISAFWDSVMILVTKPHVINKRIWGSKTLHRFFAKKVYQDGKIRKVPKQCTKFDQTDVLLYMSIILQEFELEQCNSEEKHKIEFILVELLPKCFGENHAFQLIYLDKTANIVLFYNVTAEETDLNLCPDFTFSLELEDRREHRGVTMIAIIEKFTTSYDWVATTLLPQFVKWCDELKKKNENPICANSLALVCEDKYYNKYNEVKLKYGKNMAKIWPECTDPSKFVYEDVAIATYLLLLWEDKGRFSQKQFVDLGCGNGLLVYILTKAGHKGIGIDIRKRNIWSIYPADVKLEERTIVPSDANLFPEADWIIGNHSDELTPWIPVIAARSSPNCNFFLLPCCTYNFNGTKYQRKDSSKSQYTDYINYIHDLSKACGFRTDLDRLKIPSTKRICLVGRGRTHNHEEYKNNCIKITDLVNEETSTDLENHSKLWAKDFKPREAVEKVRNCTQIDKSVIEFIVNVVTNYLLEGINVDSDWSLGKTVNVVELVSLLPHDNLKALKSECGGLQTLLKNNHQIFEVQGGKVHLRYPKTVNEVNHKMKTANSDTVRLQQKLCWFYNRHPQGCPLTNVECSYLHLKEN